MPLSENNIKAELSYAYLHAVAARAGFACEMSGRHSDNAGVDATIRVLEERLAPASVHTQFPFDVQLKATSQKPTLEAGRYSFWLEDVKRYDKLRRRSGPFPTLLAVLFLPEDTTTWLEQSEEALIARRCVYWTSLWDAPATETATGKTIYLPQANVLSVEGLRAVARRLSCKEELTYGT
ncbi:MAG: DUF4365 domain-containing protein [Planctomycetaceae bacterium]